MKIVRLSLIFGFALALLTACSEGSGKSKGSDQTVRISGQIIDGANKVVGLNRISLRGNKSMIVSTNADGRGNFSMETPDPLTQGIYQFAVGSKGVTFVLTGKDHDITINGKYNEIDRYKFDIKGSEETEHQIYAFNNMINDKWPKEQIIKYMSEHENGLIALQTGLAFMMSSPEDYAEVKKISSKIDADLRGTSYSSEFKELIAYYDQQAAQAAGGGASSGSQFNVSIGDPAPEIALPNPDGEVMRLSDLKGKVVLLDFWASWCGPCRRANPGVVEIYNKYKDQGFTVFSVSLDRNGQKNAWVQAIEQDKLAWEWHVSDLKFWQSEPAQLYGVRAIPATFLLDREGIIRKLNPRNNLEEALLEIL